jgi:ABC-type polysaccharide/polyol phosphate export permease
MREVITRFGRENLGVLWLVAEPMIFTLGVAGMWSIMGMHHSSAIPVVAFAVTGYSSVLMWRNSVGQVMHSIDGNKPLLYHRNVRVLDVMLTRLVLEMGGASGSLIVLSTIFIYLGKMPLPEDPLIVIFGWLMLAWLGSALSIFLGALAATSELAHRIWHPISYLLFPLSGAAFMVDWMPRSMQPYILLVPMVHGTELLRRGWFGHVVVTHESVGYLASVCLVLSLGGLLILREVARKLEH